MLRNSARVTGLRGEGGEEAEKMRTGYHGFDLDESWCYNAMIVPLLGMAFRGVAWYVTQRNTFHYHN
jgi:hypothetical protein